MLVYFIFRMFFFCFSYLKQRRKFERTKRQIQKKKNAWLSRKLVFGTALVWTSETCRSMFWMIISLLIQWFFQEWNLFCVPSVIAGKMSICLKRTMVALRSNHFYIAFIVQRNEFANFNLYLLGFFFDKIVRHIGNESKINEQRNDMLLK